MAGVGVPNLSLPKDPTAPCMMPYTSCQLPARAMGLCRVPRAVPHPRAVPCPGSPLRCTGSYLCPREPGVLGRWPVARVGCGVGGPLGSGWAQLLFLEEGGRCLSPPPAAVPGEGRDLPAPSFSQGEAEEGTRWWWPTCDTAVSRA